MCIAIGSIITSSSQVNTSVSSSQENSINEPNEK